MCFCCFINMQIKKICIRVSNNFKHGFQTRPCFQLVFHWVSKLIHLTRIRCSGWVRAAWIINEFEKDRGKHWNRLERPPKLECLGVIVSERFVEWFRKDIRIIAIWADKRWNCLSFLRKRSEFSSSSVPSADRSGTMCLSVQCKIGLATLLNNLNALVNCHTHSPSKQVFGQKS